MAGFTTAYSRTVLDAQLVNSDYIAWSENGSSESANLARTAIADLGNWAAATNADPAVRANTSAGLTAACSGDAKTISHFAVFSADVGGTQKTDWTALTSPRTLSTGDKLSIAAGAIGVTLT